MYPPAEILEEVGRVTVAGARVDLEMGMLWHGLDRANVVAEAARRAASSEQVKQVRTLARARLSNPLLDQVLRGMNLVERTMRDRNEVVHRTWLLRGRDAMRPVSEIPSAGGRELLTYLDEWGRASMTSEEWETVESRTMQVTRVSMDAILPQLRRLERRLDRAATKVVALQFAVGSALN